MNDELSIYDLKRLAATEPNKKLRAQYAGMLEKAQQSQMQKGETMANGSPRHDEQGRDNILWHRDLSPEEIKALGGAWENTDDAHPPFGVSEVTRVKYETWRKHGGKALAHDGKYYISEGPSTDTTSSRGWTTEAKAQQSQMRKDEADDAIATQKKISAEAKAAMNRVNFGNRLSSLKGGAVRTGPASKFKAIVLARELESAQDKQDHMKFASFWFASDEATRAEVAGNPDVAAEISRALALFDTRPA